MYLPTSAIALALLSMSTRTAAAPAISDTVHIPSHNTHSERELHGLVITYRPDTTALHKRAWPFWSQSSEDKECDCSSGDDTNTGPENDDDNGNDSNNGSKSGSGGGSAGAGAGAGAGGSGKQSFLL